MSERNSVWNGECVVQAALMSGVEGSTALYASCRPVPAVSRSACASAGLQHPDYAAHRSAGGPPRGVHRAITANGGAPVGADSSDSTAVRPLLKWPVQPASRCAAPWVKPGPAVSGRLQPDAPAAAVALEAAERAQSVEQSSADRGAVGAAGLTCLWRLSMTGSTPLSEDNPGCCAKPSCSE